jgi:hypothetical protein
VIHGFKLHFNASPAQFTLAFIEDLLHF